MSPRKKYWISILVMTLLVGGIWAIIATGCSTETSATTGRETCERPMKPRLGLDLQGGLSVVYTPKTAVKQDALDKAIEIIRNRVDALGVAEPDISRQGSNILVQLPGVKDPNEALKAIGTTAEMRFRPVLEEIPPGAPNHGTTGPDCRSEEALELADADPSKETVLCARDKTEAGVDRPREQWTKLRLGPTALVGNDVSDASANPPQGNTLSSVSWEVSLNLTNAGSRKFEKVTGELACQQGAKRQLAIVLDHIVESHPQMNETVKCREGIAGGKAQITGNFTEKDARNLALILRYGALPVALEPSTTTLVSATLGRDTLQKGLIAGAIGLGLVMLYVLVFYRVLGAIIWIGLAYFSFFTFGVVIILGKTAGFSLTLAGIAGLIVSIGIAADSYIVYYERLKDELHQGRTARAAVDRGWESAKRTIVAADLVTGLAAITLYVLAVGSVRGFALTLGLATALDVFISYLLMHPTVWLLANTRLFTKSRFMDIGRMAGVASRGEPAPVAGGQD